MMEQWRAIAGFDGYYEVSDFGAVRSLARTVTVQPRLRSPYVITVRQRLLRQTISGGYRQVTLWKGHRSSQVRVAVLVAAAFLGRPPIGSIVMFRNGRSLDCRLRNLRYATRRDLEDIKRDRGTQCTGERIPWSVLSEADVRAIRTNAHGLLQRELAAHYGVSQSQISRVQRLLEWKSVA